MTATQYREAEAVCEGPGRHELAETDEGKPHDVVQIYGAVTGLVMPAPRRGESNRHERTTEEGQA